MLKSSIRIAMLAAVTAASAFSVSAQENILANKPIYTLGEPKTWTPYLFWMRRPQLSTLKANDSCRKLWKT